MKKVLLSLSFLLVSLSCCTNIVIDPSGKTLKPVNTDNTSNNNPEPSKPIIEKKDLNFKAAIIKGSGDISPVPKTEFVFRK